ncbi:MULTISPECIES: rhodanese-like domain-containing protein [Nitrosomonas]|uniref:Rhodanese n=1 Tax=Nitrosomonas communis TaxID=44574 RepID=A0A0F7KEE8_9PROT|nr:MULTISPECIES: rhodanese-like domain-containing protein [Nitrosomonas]AKH37851.1 rhodanese [Nitrosomonas communis]TYP92873.1 rhodanese-related sulfurtransferase [Nitrosomonas communis]UVS63203.1 rhodanese-like domain-containing protein [Nitrosomonas sp. PLL12]
MENSSKILEKAHERAEEMDLPYKGALLPAEAFALLQATPNAKLIDVRCKAELDWVGRISGAIEVELKTYPGMQPNPNFIDQVAEKVQQNDVIMFLCRSGGRSDYAATIATQSDFPNCYNILEGFEGDKDETGHRGRKGGWKAADLPWVQS